MGDFLWHRINDLDLKTESFARLENINGDFILLGTLQISQFFNVVNVTPLAIRTAKNFKFIYFMRTQVAFLWYNLRFQSIGRTRHHSVSTQMIVDGILQNSTYSTYISIQQPINDIKYFNGIFLTAQKII